MSQPTALSQAYWYAKRLEQAQPSFKKFNYFPATAKGDKPWVKDKEKPKDKDQAQPTIAALKVAGKCLKCKEPWVPGHTKVCKGKQIYSVILVENAEGKVAMVEDGNSSEEQEYHDVQQMATFQISMHALTGIGKLTAIALVDSGSDASFINTKFALKSNCQVSEIDTVKVAATNGQEMLSNTASLNCPFTIQGHEFTQDLRLLSVKGYDVILGADWIYNHSPVGLDLRKREFSICKNGTHVVTFSDDTMHHNTQIIGARKLCQLLKKQAIGAVIMLTNSIADGPQKYNMIPEGLKSVLAEFEDVFKEPDHLPPTRAVDHAIPLLDENKTINQKPYRMPYHKKNAMELLIEQLLDNAMIRPSESLYSSHVILVKKKDGTWRLCVDYRKLNSNTIKNKYPIPIIEDLLDELFGAKIFSKIDLRSGYHQIRMKEIDVHKTAFTTHLGHFEYVVMPFGLTNAPATFQTLMNTILAEFLRKFALIFFDDILIYSATLQEHTQHLRAILQVLRAHKLYGKLSKCTFGQPEVEYLGHVINSQGVATEPTEIEITQKWPRPKSVTELRSFLGPTGYYRRFIQNYGIICRPLFDTLKKMLFSGLTPRNKHSLKSSKL